MAFVLKSGDVRQSTRGGGLVIGGSVTCQLFVFKTWLVFLRFPSYTLSMDHEGCRGLGAHYLHTHPG